MEPILFKEMYEVENLREDFMQILMYCEDEFFRRIIAFTIMTICKIVIQDDSIELINKSEEIPEKNSDELF